MFSGAAGSNCSVAINPISPCTLNILIDGSGARGTLWRRPQM
jgi:hypothetical protein